MPSRERGSPGYMARDEKNGMNDALFSSSSDEWSTPRDLFAALDAEFGFTLDPCASPENHTCADYFTKEQNGLSRPWGGVVFMNPPYGRAIGLWMRKAYEESQRGATVVCLVPVRTDARWWSVVEHAAEVRFIRGRLKFGNAPTSAPFPNAIIVFRPGHNGQPKVHYWDRLSVRNLTRSCAVCRAPLTGKRRDARTCSGACRFRLHYRSRAT